MASYFEDPTQWRLRTNGGIPYKLIGMSGSIESVRAAGKVRALIPGSSLIPFAREMFPEPLYVNGITIPQYARYSTTNLCISRIQYKGFDESLPSDPLGFDFFAPLGTYYPIVEVEIDLTTTPRGTQDPSNPLTFLEISADSTGEFIYSPPTNASWQSVSIDGDGNAIPDPFTAPEPNRDPVVPHTVVVPKTTWSVSWKQIPYLQFLSVIQPRLEYLMGKVNSEPFTILYASWKESLLLMGYTYKYAYSWRDGYVDNPLIDLDVKFVEKRIIENVYDDDGTTLLYTLPRGHNDVWRPGYGWDRMLLNGKPTYEKADLNLLFDTAT